MVQAPSIIVQIIHIEGPLKGQIQEFSSQEISIGRHPSCGVRFPAKLGIVSRQHARIIRQGNRFKLLDSSSNGTILNGKNIKEAFLKDGDVLTIAEGGPKISFLTKISNVPLEPAVSPCQPEVMLSPSPLEQRVKTPSQPPTPPPSKESKPVGFSDVPQKRVKAPLTIQLGPTLRRFEELPISIGKGADCEFRLESPGILDRHALIFFAGNQYWIKDLTGQKLVKNNHRPVDLGTPLSLKDELTLSPEGPAFRFLGDGRLVEIETPRIERTPPGGGAKEDKSKQTNEEKLADKPKSILERFFPRG